MIIFYDLLKQYIFFLLTCLCVRTHCKPITCNENSISLWSHSNSKILSLSEGILLSLQGKPVTKTGFPCLIPVLPCMGLQCTLSNKMLWRTPWFHPRTCNTANTANIFDKTELPCVRCCINSVFHHGFLIDHLITIWTLNKKLNIARTECLNSYLYPPEIIKRVQYTANIYSEITVETGHM